MSRLKVNTCHLALPVPCRLGAKISLPCAGRRTGPGGSSMYSDIQRTKVILISPDSQLGTIEGQEFVRG